jgi:mannose-6-phosphate isomerase-like protein (cupin superfamily)
MKFISRKIFRSRSDWLYNLFLAGKESKQHTERDGGDSGKNGYIIQRESEITISQPGPHNGGGETSGCTFFEETAGLNLLFRKRILYPGSAIGYHEQKHDEIYYILKGSGEFTVNGKKITVVAGDGILTRPGSSHGLRQTGKDALILFYCTKTYNVPAERLMSGYFSDVLNELSFNIL